MSEAEKIALVQSLTGNAVEDSVASQYIKLAGSKILARMYPMKDVSDKECPDKYAYIQCELASRYILKRGSEGETAHNEDGVNRAYGSANDEDLLCEVMQVLTV